VHFCLLLLFMC